MTLYHYFERDMGPLRNLSDMPLSEAQDVLDQIKAAGLNFAAHRAEGYLERRHELEQHVRVLFIAKGGLPVRVAPHYFVAEACPWLETWYQQPEHIVLPAESLDLKAISFTYGDMFPTFSPKVQDGREYRGIVYTYPEILQIIRKHGLPQHWNANGKHGPERYIEAQVWCDIPQALITNTTQEAK